MTEHAWRLTVLDRVVGARQLPVETIGQPDGNTQVGAAANYEVTGTLGKGGMALVLDARQTSLEREVALKIFRPSNEDGSDLAEELKQFAREAVLTARLDHPNIVPIYALAKDHKGRLFFTMKKVDGIPWRFLLHPEDLRDEDMRSQVAIRAETLDWKDHLRILLKVMDAVAYAHSKGILHRDLKPSNVMVGDFGEVYVMDWGLAMPFGPDAGPDAIPEDELNDKGEIKIAGTLRYMAPEQIRGEYSRFSEATDIHLLGGVLFEIVTGRAPRAGKSQHEIIAAAVAGKVEDPARVPGARHVTPHLRRIILQALDPDPERRYANVTVMRADIEAHLVHADAFTVAEDAAIDLAALSDDLLVRAADGSDSIRRLARDDAVVAYDRLTECVSRLRGSLAQFPMNGPARSSLLDALVLQIRLAIGQGDLTLAQAQLKHLHEVPGPGTDETFTRTVQGHIQALGLAIHAERRRRKGTFLTARWLKPLAAVATILAVAGMIFGYVMADARRDEAIRSGARMFQVAVQGRVMMLDNFLVDIERLTEQYRAEAVALLGKDDAPLEAPQKTAAGRAGYYLDADFYVDETAPFDLAPREGYDNRVSMTYPTVVMAPWVDDKPETLEVARTDAARLSRLGRRFGQAHRTYGTVLKWSLAGTRTGLLIGFPGSGRYQKKPDYDPTQRPWFKLAIDAPDDKPRWGVPYTDASTGLRLIPCMARIRVGEATMGVVGVEVTLETAQQILLDFAREGSDEGLRALLLRPDTVGEGETARETLTVLIDTAEEVKGADWRHRPRLLTLDELDDQIRDFVAQVMRDHERSPLVLGERMFTHAFLERYGWLLVVTTEVTD